RRRSAMTAFRVKTRPRWFRLPRVGSSLVPARGSFSGRVREECVQPLFRGKVASSVTRGPFNLSFLEHRTGCSRRLSADFRRIASLLLLRIPPVSVVVAPRAARNSAAVLNLFGALDSSALDGAMENRGDSVK